MITQKLNINLIPGGIRKRVKVSQYDDNGTYLEITLYNGVNKFAIPTGSKILIQGTKADNTGFQYECTYSGSVVTAPITEQMAAFENDVVTELVIVSGKEKKGTENFILEVETAALKSDIEISETDIPTIARLDRVANELDDAIAKAKESETNAKASEEAAALSESNAKQSEDNAKESESNAKESEEAAALSESNAKQSEDNAKESESNAKESEEAAALSESNAKQSEDNAKASELNAKASEELAALLESNAKQSEDNAKVSESNAKASEESAANSAERAAESASLLGTMTGTFKIIAENGHLVLSELPGFGGKFSIERTNGRMMIEYA